MVCFGVFPAMICYCLGMNHIPGVIILCLYCVASVIRLGYFNVMEEKRQNETSELRHYYQGLPITSMAIIQMCIRDSPIPMDIGSCQIKAWRS